MRNTLIILLIIGSVYLWTLPKGIGFGDAGTMAAAATSLGIPHPPGFPTFVLLGHLFSKLPLGSGLFRLQILSVIGGIGLIGMVGMMESWSTAILVAVLYGVWSQTGNVESYLLTNLFIFGITYLALSKRPPLILGILLGVASGLNPVGIVAVPVLLYLFGVSKKSLTVFIIAGVVGVLIYAYLPLRAAMHPFLNWGDPQTILALYGHLTGGGLNINSPAVINGFVLSLRWMLDAFMRFGYLAVVQLNIVLLFVVWGAITVYKKDVKKFWILIIILISNLLVSSIYISGNRDLWLTTGLIVLVIFAGHALKKWLWFVAFAGLLLVNRPFKADLTSQYVDDLYKDLPVNSIVIGGGETFNALSLYEYEVVKNKMVIPVDMTIFYGQDWYRNNLKLNTDLKVSDYNVKFGNELEFSQVLEKFVTENPSKTFFVTGYLLTTPIYANSNKPAYIPNKYTLVQHGLVYQLTDKPIEPTLLNSSPPKVSFLESNYQKGADQIAMEYGFAYEWMGDFFKAARVAPKYFDQNRLKTKIAPVPSDK